MDMKNCTCGGVLKEIGGINKPLELGEYRKTEGSDHHVLHRTGMRDTILYQCESCKSVSLE